MSIGMYSAGYPGFGYGLPTYGSPFATGQGGAGVPVSPQDPLKTLVAQNYVLIGQNQQQTQLLQQIAANTAPAVSAVPYTGSSSGSGVGSIGSLLNQILPLAIILPLFKNLLGGNRSAGSSGSGGLLGGLLGGGLL